MADSLLLTNILNGSPGVDSDAANRLVELIRRDFILKKIGSDVNSDASIKLTSAEEFS